MLFCCQLKNKEVLLAYWALAAISILWGTTWFVSRLTIQHIPPLQLCSIRQTIAGLFFILLFNVFNKIPWPGFKETAFNVMLGFLFFTTSNGLTTLAIKFIPSYLGALLGCLMPFVLVLLGWVMYKEKLKPILLLALLTGFAGVSIILLSFGDQIAHGKNFAFGIGITLFTVFTWSFGSLLSTRNKHGYVAKHGIGWQMLFGGIMLFFFSRFTEDQVNISNLSGNAWAYIFYLIIVGSIICFQCYLYALKHLPLGLVSIYVYINPIVALLLGVLLLNEHFTWPIVIGSVVTFLGIYLVKRFNK